MQLIDDLMSNYNSLERPAPIDNQPLKVEFQVTLRNIIDVVRNLRYLCTYLVVSV